jgi:hypothetical protein
VLLGQRVHRVLGRHGPDSSRPVSAR